MSVLHVLSYLIAFGLGFTAGFLFLAVIVDRSHRQAIAEQGKGDTAGHPPEA